VKNPKHASKGVREISLDGKKLRSNIVKDMGGNRVNVVNVIMG